jgi:hypothetical protein
MDLFEFQKVFYEDQRKFEQLDKFEKSKVFFPFNRKMAIKFPEQANFFNFNGIDQASVIDVWYEFVGKRSGGRTPSWNYIKVIKPVKDKKWYPKDAKMFSKYRDFYQMSIRDFEEGLEFVPEETKKHYENFASNFDT